MAFREEVIGPHRLICGDYRDAVAYLSWDSIVSDPPFGMSFQSNYRTVGHAKIHNDDDCDILAAVCAMPAAHSKYVFARWDNLRDLPKPKSLITWVKNNWSMGDLEHEHARQTEVALFYAGPQHFFPSGRPSDVIHAPRTGNNFHPTEKPVQLMQAIVSWTSGVVMDCCMGSGTTGVACVNMGRTFIGIELDPGYFDIACRRVEAAMRQPRLDLEPAPKAVQETLDL